MGERVREYPADVESRPGFCRAGTRSGWAIYRVTDQPRRDHDARFAVVFDERDADGLVAAMNAAVDDGGILDLRAKVAERDATITRLTDLVNELRKQLEGHIRRSRA